MSSRRATPSPPTGPPSLLPRPGAPPKINSIYDFSSKGLGELKAWMETWTLNQGRQDTTPAIRAEIARRFQAIQTGSIPNGVAGEIVIPHNLGVAPLAVASPASGSAQGVYVESVTADEEKIVIRWSEGNKMVSANVIAMLP